MKSRHTDDQHLRLLTFFHYGLGLFGNLAGVLIGVMYAGMGVYFERVSGRPQPGMSETFLIMGVVVAALSLISGAMTIAAGWCIARRRHRTFCLVTAALNLPFMPLGTVLAVFTFVVLLRESVVDRFEGAERRDGLRGPLQS